MYRDSFASEKPNSSMYDCRRGKHEISTHNILADIPVPVRDCVANLETATVNEHHNGKSWNQS